MFRSRGENLHSLYVLLFLQVAFFFMQLQDPERYVNAFALDRGLVLSGQFWRLFTFQFLTGSFLGSAAIGLFFTLLILYIMGSAIEEEYGTGAFITLFLLSTLATAAIPMILGIPLLGSFFLGYTLLFIYAHLYPDQTFLLMMIVPVKVKWLAWLAIASLVLGVLGRDAGSLAAAVGSIVGYGYFRIFLKSGPLVRFRPPLPDRAETSASQNVAKQNLERFDEIEQALANGSKSEREALIIALEPGLVPDVNICPPADYKPRGSDMYCVQCEGFNECSIRFIRISAETKEALDEDVRGDGTGGS